MARAGAASVLAFARAGGDGWGKSRLFLTAEQVHSLEPWFRRGVVAMAAIFLATLVAAVFFGSSLAYREALADPQPTSNRRRRDRKRNSQQAGMPIVAEFASTILDLAPSRALSPAAAE